MIKGIDISQHNGNIDFEQVKNDGIEFVIIRVGWIGNKQNHTLDTKFEENYKKALEMGFKIGVYVYSYCKTVETLRQGVSWLLDKIENKQPEIGVFLDLEDETIQGIGKEILTEQAKQFCSILTQIGYNTGIYANKYWFNNLLNIKELERYLFWLAEWNGKEEPTANFKTDIWQYTDKGQVSGIVGNVDMNKIIVKDPYTKPTIDIEQLARDVIEGKYGNGQERKDKLGNLYQEVQNRVNEILKQNSNNDIVYIVKKGDCLCKIAKKFNTTVGKIAEDNNIKNVNLIYAGQKLVIRK